MRWLLVLAIVALGPLPLACERSSPPPAPAAGSDSASTSAPSIELPEVSAAGWAPADREAVFVATTSAVSNNGQLLVAIHDGQIDAADKDGGALGRVIARVRARAANLERGATITFAIDKRLSFRLLTELVSSVTQAGHAEVAVLARSGGRTVLAPLRVPSREPSKASTVPGLDLGSQIAVLARSGGRTVLAPSHEPSKASTVPGSDLGSQIAMIRDPRMGVDRAPASFRVVTKQVTPATATLTADAIVSKLQAVYGAGIKRCARTLDQPAAATIELAIDAHGRSVHPGVSSSATELASCVETQAGSWRFATPKDGAGAPTEIAATIVLALLPGAPRTAIRDPHPPTGRVDAMVGEPDEPLRPTVDPATQPVRMVVSVTRTELVVWSISGLEGTLSQPLRRIPTGSTAAAELGQTLAELVKRRWDGTARTAENRTIMIMADLDTSMQTFAELLGAARTAPDGHELFPEVVLSAGFE